MAEAQNEETELAATSPALPPVKIDRPGTKVLDYVGLGLILAPPAVVFEMYLKDELNWQKAIIASLVAWLFGAFSLLASPRWERWRSHDTRIFLRWGSLESKYWGRILIVAFLVAVPFAFSSLISRNSNNGTTTSPSSEIESLTAQKATLIEWLKQAQQQASNKQDEIDRTNETLKNSIAPLVAERDQLRQQIATMQSQLQDTRHQLDAARQAAHIPPPPPPPEDQVPINWTTDFQLNWSRGTGVQIIWLRFMGQATALAHIKDAYIISSLTGHKEQLKVFNLYNSQERWNIDEIEPITTGAAINLVYEWTPPISLNDFINQWSAFEFHVVYDNNKEYVRSFDKAFMDQKMTGEMPGVVGPRVTPKSK